jgi:hypothetical protein
MWEEDGHVGEGVGLPKWKHMTSELLIARILRG